MKKKEIKVMIRSDLLELVNEHHIDLDTFINKELPDYIDRRLESRKLQETYEQIIENSNKFEEDQFIIRIIKKQSRRSKLRPYATKSAIYEEAELESMTSEDVDRILKRLLCDKFISQPYQMAYRITGKLL